MRLELTISWITIKRFNQLSYGHRGRCWIRTNVTEFAIQCLWPLDQSSLYDCGECRIRTYGTFRFAAFQEQCDRPLCQFSIYFPICQWTFIVVPGRLELPNSRVKTWWLCQFVYGTVYFKVTTKKNSSIKINLPSYWIYFKSLFLKHLTINTTRTT